jgi:hypothetical protein
MLSTSLTLVFLETEACQWVKSNQKYKINAKIIKIDHKTLYCVPSHSSNEKLTTNEIKEHYTRLNSIYSEWSSYDKYVKDVRKIKYVQINDTNWKLSQCFCYNWSKNYICKHVIGLSELLNYCEFSEHAKQIQIGNKRSRGRPKNTKQALQRQDKSANTNESDTALSDFDLFDNNNLTTFASGITKPHSKLTEMTAPMQSPEITSTAASSSVQITKFATENVITSSDYKRHQCEMCSANLIKRKFWFCPNKCKHIKQKDFLLESL